MNPSKYCDPPSKRALEVREAPAATGVGRGSEGPPSPGPMARRHLSKSASELSGGGGGGAPPERRPRSAAPPGEAHLTVYQKAHSFFAQLRSRLGHHHHHHHHHSGSGRRERRHKNASPGRTDSTDYAADLSGSDHSTPSTLSPRHRLHARTDSPLSRACGSGDTSSPGGSPRPRAPTPGALAGLDLLPLTSTDEVSRRREAALRQHSFFQLRIYLRRGHGLVSMDKNGLSDPYVKFKCGGRLVYKSRTVYRDLNPVWDESFTVPIEDPFLPITIKVFDYDWGLQDDFMGSASLDLSTLDIGRPNEITLPLQDPSKPAAQLGEILLSATLYPKTQEDKEQVFIEDVKRSEIRDRYLGVYGSKNRANHQERQYAHNHPLTMEKINRKPASHIRRHIKTKFSGFRYKLSDEYTGSLQDLSSTDIDQFSGSLKRMVGSKGSNTSLDSCGESETISMSSSDTRLSSSTRSTCSDTPVSRLAFDNTVAWPDKNSEDCSTLDKIKRTFKQMYFQKNSRIQDVNKRLKSQIWSSVVTIVLVEGRNLLACDPETGTSDPYVKFRLGNEKYKSRVIWRSLNPRWLEQLDLHLYDEGDHQLEITAWDKDRARDDFIGRCVIDLGQLERERTHSLWQELEDGAGSLHLLLTISGTTASETISDLTTYEENPRERETIAKRYLWHRTFHNIKDVGHLTVKVFKATGLAAADLGGKSDPFCVLELGNARLQTQTEYKTLTPQWNKIFTFNVKDINSVLEMTVFDEDRDHKVEFLGKVAIPLLRIKSGERRWYALKDKKLRSRAKGNCPQILLEMHLEWNPIRACIRTLNPKEEKYMQTEVKFKRQVFVKNVLRVKVFAIYFYEVGKLFQNCFEWESTIQSFAALVVWMILCYYFQPWMVPVAGLLVFLKAYVVRALAGPVAVPWDETADSDQDEEDDEDKEKEEKKSLKERLQTIQEVTQGVQNAIGKLATLLEGIKNMFNFTVPYLSWIAITMLAAATLILYFIPMRYLLILWGINKFCRRIFRPHSVPNNELLDLLSRIPDDEMLMYIKMLGASLSTHIGRLSVIRWYLQLDYKDLKLLMGQDGGGGGGGGADCRRRDAKKKHKAS